MQFSVWVAVEELCSNDVICEDLSLWWRSLVHFVTQSSLCIRRHQTSFVVLLQSIKLNILHTMEECPGIGLLLLVSTWSYTWIYFYPLCNVSPILNVFVSFFPLSYLLSSASHTLKENKYTNTTIFTIVVKKANII